MLGTRRGILISMDSKDSQTRLTYSVPSKGLIGFTTEFLTATHGYGIMNHIFSEYKEITPDTFTGRKQHVLVSINSGAATAYACGQIEDRGILFIEPNENVQIQSFDFKVSCIDYIKKSNLTKQRRIDFMSNFINCTFIVESWITFFVDKVKFA